MIVKEGGNLKAGHTGTAGSHGTSHAARSTYSLNGETLGPFAINTIQCIDCIEGMRRIPTDSVDIVIADPPYNASKGNRWKWDSSSGLPGFGGDWSKIEADWDNLPLEDYVSMTFAWLQEVKRVARPSGSIWIHGTYHNAGIINFAMQLLGIEIINEVVWYKRNSFPNLSGRRLTASHETILWAHTGGKERRYHFNYEAAKAIGEPTDMLKQPGKQLRTVWDIPNNKKRSELLHGKHPAQKPLRLIRRMLEISAKPGDILLAPFSGVGSECVAAKEHGMRFLGFESDSGYVEIAQRRLGHLQSTLCEVSDSTYYQTTPAEILSRPENPRRYQPIPSLIKWTGSKRSQAAMIAQYVPSHRRYFEPFLGGGALLFLLGRAEAVTGDIYAPLVHLWQLVRDDPKELISNYTSQWQLLQENLPEYYYETRERFNNEPNPLDLNFLTRTCVNGIIRFNGEGRFNNSFHLSRKGMQPERFAKIVTQWHIVIQNATFQCADYSDTLLSAKEGDFVYLDPPYAGNKMRYTANLDIERFFGELEGLNRRNVKWALSFDGHRGERAIAQTIPRYLYRQCLLLPSGNSAVGKVLNGPVESVYESLYLNY